MPVSPSRSILVLVLLSASAAMAIGVIGAFTLHERMFDDRLDTIRAVARSTVAIARGLEPWVGRDREIHPWDIVVLFRRLH